jgi:hypothetical protein
VPAARVDLPPPQPERLIGYCGAPSSAALGAMTGDLAAAGNRLSQQIAAYPADRPARPVVELIATVAGSKPGSDGQYRTRSADSVVGEYLRQARAMHGFLLINIQPGHASFLPEVQAYERWLTEPDVGVALDPEWHVPAGVTPGRRLGSVTGEELDSVAVYLSQLASAHSLTQRMFVYHQLAASIVRNEEALKPHDGVHTVKVVDGIGNPQLKLSTWRTLMRSKPDHVAPGFKLFYDEDTRHGSHLMAPADVLALQPQPEYIVYE